MAVFFIFRAHIVGWPPVKDFRKVRTIAECEGENGWSSLSYNLLMFVSCGQYSIRNGDLCMLFSFLGHRLLPGDVFFFRAQIVGWPPVKDFKKVRLLNVKVSMDGAPYITKMDLKTYSTYRDLSSALEKLFGCLIH